MGDDNGNVMAIEEGSKKFKETKLMAMKLLLLWLWDGDGACPTIGEMAMKCWREVVTPVVVLQKCENIMIVGFVISSDGSKWRASYTSQWLNFHEKNQIFQILLQSAFAHPFCFLHFGEFSPKKEKKSRPIPIQARFKNLLFLCFYHGASVVGAGSPPRKGILAMVLLVGHGQRRKWKKCRVTPKEWGWSKRPTPRGKKWKKKRWAFPKVKCLPLWKI